MSYCRFSSDDFLCDLYCYESDTGYITHVAGNKLIYKEPIPEYVSPKNMSLFMERYRYVEVLRNRADRVPIELPHAGETFCDSTLEEFLATVITLKNLGYHVPDSAINRIEAEMEETNDA